MAVDTDTCRLCLRPIDKANCTDLMTETTKLIMLKDLLPKVNFEVCKNTIVCNNCIQELETFYNFKRGVIVNETNIQTKLDQNGLKIMDLKLMLDDVAKKGILDDDYLCRICLSICRTPNISLFDSPSNVMPYSFVKKMCQVVFELEFIASDKPVLCNKCWETLQAIYNFRKNCLRTDKKLQIYITSRNITLLSLDEFKIFANENLPKGDNENSSDEELDGYIKEEPLDHDNFEFDHYEPLCSLNSVIVNEEVSIKDEYELKIEDEPEMLDPKDISEVDELGGENCNMEIEDIKIDLDAIGSFEPFGEKSATSLHRVTRSKLHLRPHMLSYQADKTRSCKYCSYKTKYKFSLKQHILLHVPYYAVQMFQCSSCPYVTKFLKEIRSHVTVHQRHSLERVQQIAKRGYEDKEGSITNNRACESDNLDLFSCPHCAYTTKNKSSLKRHMITHQPDNEVRMFLCTQCSFGTRRKSVLKVHALTHQPDDAIQMYQCAHCGLKTKYKSALKKHIWTHLPDEAVQMFACTYCTYRTRYKSDLKNHLLIHQPTDEIQMFNCLDCSYKTRNKSHLKVHMLKHRPDDKVQMFSCADCSYKTKHKPSLSIHFRIHQSDDKVRIKCAHCSYSARRKSHLRQHLQIHRSK